MGTPVGPAHATRRMWEMGCRCDLCTAAHEYRLRKVREAHYRRQAQGPPDHMHGTENAYNNYGCRCSPCKDAHRVQNAKRPSRTLVPRS